MDNFRFCSPTEFIFGRNTQHETGRALASRGASKVLIVYGSERIRQTGLLGEVEDSLRQAGIEFVEFGGVQPNPTAKNVYEGISIAVKEGVNFILAIGGGSPIDAAKGIALGAVYTGDFWDFYSKKGTPQFALPVGVVLTIPAAGSEGSGNSVITNEETHQKISVRYPDLLRPRFAIMNPELTYSLPQEQTAYGVVDMMAHIYERYFSNTGGTSLVDAYSEAIMREVMDDALTLKLNPDDYDARANVMWAGTLAHNGLCGVGKVEDWASHRLEHEISAYYGVAHGAGLAVIIPAWMEFCARKNPDKLWRFAINVMSVNPANKDTLEIIDEGISELKNFYHDLGLTTNLRELIGREPDIDMLVRSLQRNMGETLGEYVELSMDDCREIYKIACEG
ncbi:MAG: iron-containing alcohol dehydrogenase [Candidatus Amulumruptor caecigallinarius]|nr:iron-containing alcohol dehydrogenase [Candidatus Amulumruptor caecigallinarius]